MKILYIDLLLSRSSGSLLSSAEASRASTFSAAKSSFFSLRAGSLTREATSRALLNLEGLREDILSESENVAEVHNTIVGQEPVVIAPVVGLSGEGARDEGLHQQVDVQVGNLSEDVVVAVDILLGNKNTLVEEHLVDFGLLFFGYVHY